MRRWMETTQKGSTRSRNFPQISTDSVLLTATIDEHEVLNVRMYDIPVTCISAEMYMEMIMELFGRLAELMVNIEPHIYIQYVIYEKGIPVLYATLNKAVYGCMILVLLLCERLV